MRVCMYVDEIHLRGGMEESPRPLQTGVEIVNAGTNHPRLGAELALLSLRGERTRQ